MGKVAVRPFSLSPVTTVLWTLCVLLFAVSIAAAQDADNELWVPGEYIVKYDETKLHQLKRLVPGLNEYSNEQLEEALTQTLGAQTQEELPLIEAQTIKADSGDELDIDAAVDLLDAELAEYISPNFVHRTNRVPNDPNYGTLWGLNQSNDVDINAPEAWDVLTDDSASDIIVAVIDTGIDYNHPDLAANMWKNPSELNGTPGVDDDGNGVVDDIYGYNAITNSGNPMDDHNHGTHCAGTIGGVGNNGVGVTGVAWKVKLMALKFLSSSGSGSDSNAIKAINYGISMRNRGGKLKVMSNSWGGSGYNPAMLAAIRAANDAGILFTAAAGNSNSNNDATANYPSNYDSPNVVAVAALGQNGAKASFSSYGATMVDLAAPGVGILSTTRNNSYASYNGTSMATPHVSGVAALVYSRVPQLSPADVRQQLMQTVKPIAALNGLMLAPGIVNAQAALADPSNYPPDLASIPDALVNPSTRLKTIALLATDRENDPLTFTATVSVPGWQSVAANLDLQYNFASYLPQHDNYYHLGEKRLLTAAGQTFFILPDATLHELQLPYYYYRGSVDPIFYFDPNLLVNASGYSASSIATLSIIPGTPYELRIDTAKDYKGSFTASVSVSDGNRSDIENIAVSVQKAGSCQ